MLLSNIYALDVTSAYLSWTERHVFLGRLRFLLHVHLFRNPISRSNFTALYVFWFFIFCFLSRFLIFLLFKFLCFNSLKVSLDIGFFCFFLHSNFLFITFFFFLTWNEYAEFCEMYTIFFRNRQLSQNKTLNERLVWFWNRQSFMCYDNLSQNCDIPQIMNICIYRTRYWQKDPRNNTARGYVFFTHGLIPILTPTILWELQIGTRPIYYRPQRSWAKVIFLQACVCPQGGRGVCLSACWDAHRPPLGADPPGNRPPSWEADCSIRLTSGRYVSYWNAFLLLICSLPVGIGLYEKAMITK